jgi:hypothetical protein
MQYFRKKKQVKEDIRPCCTDKTCSEISELPLRKIQWNLWSLLKNFRRNAEPTAGVRIALFLNLVVQ